MTKEDIKINYNIFECFIKNDFKVFYEEELSELSNLGIFISPYVYKVSLYQTKYKTSRMFYTLYNDENKKYVVLSLKEYMDLKTVKCLLEKKLIVEYYKDVLEDNHGKFLDNFNKYKEINKGKNIVLSFILSFIINHDNLSYYFLSRKKLDFIIKYYYNSHVGDSKLAKKLKYNLEELNKLKDNTEEFNKNLKLLKKDDLIEGKNKFEIYKNDLFDIIFKELEEKNDVVKLYNLEQYLKEKKFKFTNISHDIKNKAEFPSLNKNGRTENTPPLSTPSSIWGTPKVYKRVNELNTRGGASKSHVVNYTQNINLNLHEKLESLKQVKGSLIQMMRKLNMRIPVGHILGGRINDDIEKLKEENSNIIYKFIKKYKKLSSSMKYQVRHIMKTFNNIIIKDN